MADKSSPFAFLSRMERTDKNMTNAARGQAIQRAAGIPQGGGGQAVGGGSQAQQYALQRLKERGLGDNANYQALVNLWNKESGWNPTARNASSGAYGIAQMMPMHGHIEGAQGQIDWGIDYILRRYGNPLAAWQHSQRTNWY